MRGALLPAAPPRPYLGTRTFALLTLAFLFITVYGSLVPFVVKPLSWEEGVARWHEVCAKPLGMNSRTDFVTNVLLFIPLSFLLVGTLAVDRGRLMAILAAVLIIPLCAALSASIEFTQIWFEYRESSLNDVLAETLGAVVGSATWILAGQRLTGYARSFWIALGPENLAVKLMPVYLFLLILVHVMPLDLTISPGELKLKWKEGRIILIPFTTNYGGVGNGIIVNAWTVVYFFPLGLLLALWPRQTFRSGLKVLAIGLLTAAAIQFLKLFVWTRYCDATAVLTGGAAVWLGWLAVQAWNKYRATVGDGPSPSWVVLIRPGLFLIWLLAMVVANWYPFDLPTEEEVMAAHLSKEQIQAYGDTWVVSKDGRLRALDYHVRSSSWTLGPFIAFTDAEVIRQRWLDTSLAPMADLYLGTEYHAFDEFVRKTLLFLPLGAMLVPLSTPSGRFGWWRALLAGLLLSCVFEAGKLLVPSRFCSTSNVLIETNAAFVGFLLWQRLRVLLKGQAGVESFPPVRTSEQVRKPVGLGVFVTED
jgi:VanZ family protein